MSRANLCDNCHTKLDPEGRWYMAGIREPKPTVESMFAFLSTPAEPQVVEFCTPVCLIAYFMAQSALGEVAL